MLESVVQPIDDAAKLVDNALPLVGVTDRCPLVGGTFAFKVISIYATALVLVMPDADKRNMYVTPGVKTDGGRASGNAMLLIVSMA